MKKFFTILAAALMTSVSIMAETAVISWNMGEDGAAASGANSITGATGCDAEGFTIAITGNLEKSWSAGNGDITYNEKTYKTLKNSNGAQNTITLPANYEATQVDFYVVANADSDGKLSEFNGENCNDAVTSHKDYSNPTHITKALNNATSFTFTFSTKQVCFIAVVTYSAASTSDPVSTVSVSGKEACYVGKTITLTATTDVKADDYKWAVNGVDQTGAEAKSFDFTPTAEGTFSIICYAKNANNDGWVASAAHQVVATEKTILTELVPVDGSVTWDFNNIADATVQAASTTDTIIYWNLDAEWAEGFASTKLAGCAQYHYNAGSYQCFQGTVLKFVTTVPGKVSVQYSNTGSERPYRYVEVNGVLSATGSASTTKIISEDFVVEAGNVIIKFYIPVADDPKAREGDAVGYTMARVYKLVFTKDTGSAIENTEAGVKAVKVMRDGKLFIEKNGVVYNAQGTIVK